MGNLLWFISVAASLAKRYGEDYRAVVNENYYCTPPDDCYLPDYIAPLKDTIFRNVPFADKVSENAKWYACNRKGEEIPIKKGKDICLYSSVDTSAMDKEVAQALFAPDDVMAAELKQRYPVLNHPHTCSIAVRRGDFLTLPVTSPAEDMAYYRKCMRRLERDIHTRDVHYIVTSDDYEWCKERFQGKQFTVVDESPLVELYITSLCRYNILSNSTFAVWGGVLNIHEDKHIYYPNPMGGIGARKQSYYRLDAPHGWIPVKHYSYEFLKGVLMWVVIGMKKCFGK